MTVQIRCFWTIKICVCVCKTNRPINFAVISCFKKKSVVKIMNKSCKRFFISFGFVPIYAHTFYVL